MMGILLENIYDLLVKPKDALREISEHRTILQAFWIRLGAILLLALGMGAGTFSSGMLFLAIVLQVIASMAFWLLSVAVWHLLAEFMGGSGSAKKLLTATGFIAFLQILVIPFCLLAMSAGDVGAMLVGLVNILIWFWCAGLEILAIAINYELSPLRAAFVWALPLIALLGIIVLIVCAAGSVFMATIAGFFIGM